jgi:hypothetical protein
MEMRTTTTRQRLTEKKTCLKSRLRRLLRRGDTRERVLLLPISNRDGYDPDEDRPTEHMTEMTKNGKTALNMERASSSKKLPKLANQDIW